MRDDTTRVTVRPLLAKDVRLVARLLATELDAIQQMVEVRPDESKETRAMRVGLDLFKALLVRHLDVLWEWLADVGGMTPEELDAAPAETPVLIIEGLAEGDGLRSFFARARSLAERLETRAPPGPGTG